MEPKWLNAAGEVLEMNAPASAPIAGLDPDQDTSSPFPETADIETSNDDYATRFRGATGAWMLRVQEKAVMRLLRRAGVAPGATILDVGGGHGQLAHPLADAGYKVTVIGSAPSCRHRIRDLVDSGKTEFLVGNVVDLPFPDGAFDAVIAVRMLTHCSVWPTLVKEMCRVSRGPVVTDYPTNQSLNAIAPALFKAKKKFEKNTRTWTLFRHREVRDAFAKNGFTESGRVGQFFLPMVVHRALKCKPISAALEGICSALGLSRLWGTPVVGLWQRDAESHPTSGATGTTAGRPAAVFAAALLASVAAVGCVSGRCQDVPVVSLLSPGQKAWFARPLADRVADFKNEEKRAAMKALGDKPLAVDISFAGIASDSATPQTLHNLETGRLYNFDIVAGSNTVGHVAFRTEDVPPRLIGVPGIPNVRDFGGWRGLGGRRVRQGVIFRSAGLNENATPKDEPTMPGATRVTEDTRRVLVGELGVKTDLDLRNDKECFGMHGSPLGPDVDWQHHSFSLYQWMEGDEAKATFARVFRLLLDTSHHPVVMHCIEGQDRTGTLCFILNGLLGVSEDDLMRDWEATGFHNPSVRFRHESRIDPFVRFLSKFPGENVNERIEAYAISCGIMPEEIEAWRALMLEP